MFCANTRKCSLQFSIYFFGHVVFYVRTEVHDIRKASAKIKILFLNVFLMLFLVFDYKSVYMLMSLKEAPNLNQEVNNMRFTLFNLTYVMHFHNDQPADRPTDFHTSPLPPKIAFSIQCIFIHYLHFTLRFLLSQTEYFKAK